MQIVNRKQLRQKPTHQLSYHQGLQLVRQFLHFASQHTVEELQAFTSQWVPWPRWVKVDHVNIPEDKLLKAAELLQEQLGPDGIRKVGGNTWWQWRREGSPLVAEWIEMRKDYNARQLKGGAGDRIILYVHGGAYYFGSVDEHRYQMQRHARKLNARVFAPKYRLAPQFPFPCAIQDCLASYLYLLDIVDQSKILLVGDSAGAGMILSILVILRDRGVFLPAGAILISPWVDLTHSFPSLAGDSSLDYIPAQGFVHKPSMCWPPPTADDLKRIRPDHRPEENVPNPHAELSILLDGQRVDITEQIQLYAPNHLLSHPLVSPVLQPTLGGLPPLLIQVGGSELLRDEQIYLAHKAAQPLAYPPSKAVLDEHDPGREQLNKFGPTDVQLQVWDDLCHVATTLSFTRPAKFMYRSAAQFGAWALAQAQDACIDILIDDNVSVVSDSSSNSRDAATQTTKEVQVREQNLDLAATSSNPSSLIGKAGDPLPSFDNHMIRQRVDYHGHVHPLAPPSDLPAMQLSPEEIGVIKEGPVRKWLETRKRWDERFERERRAVQEQRLKEMQDYDSFGDGEVPPPTALAGRRKRDIPKPLKRTKSIGLSIWSGWGSKHDKLAVSQVYNTSKPYLHSIDFP